MGCDENPITDWGTVPLAAHGGSIAHLSLQCGVCGWARWGHTQDSLDRAYAAHLNDERHLASVQAARERDERIEEYRLADVVQRAL